MRYLRIDTREWQNPRLYRLMSELDITLPEGIGILAILWHVTRAAGLEEASENTLEDILAFRLDNLARVIPALRISGYLEGEPDEALKIVDNVGCFEARARRVAAAKAGVEGRAKKPKPKAPRKPRAAPKAKLAPSPNTPVWQAYAEAYEQRWGYPPPRNAHSNKIIEGLVKRIGVEDAQHLVRFYVSHNKKFYLERVHDIQYCLKDCAPLFTQMRRGEPITDTAVYQAERHNHFMTMEQQIRDGQI